MMMGKIANVPVRGTKSNNITFTSDSVNNYMNRSVSFTSSSWEYIIKILQE